MKNIIIVIVILILIGGGIWFFSTLTPEPEEVIIPEEEITEEVEDEIADTSVSSVQAWQTYTNPAANFTFEYPKDWEIREEYFYKDNPDPTIVICGKEEPEGVIANCIQINMPQFPCETVSWVNRNWIGICVNDPGIVGVYEKLVSSFIFIE